MSPRVKRPLPQSFAYEHTDVPPGVTLAEYRRARAPQPRRRPVSRVRRSLRARSR